MSTYFFYFFIMVEVIINFDNIFRFKFKTKTKYILGILVQGYSLILPFNYYKLIDLLRIIIFQLRLLFNYC